MFWARCGRHQASLLRGVKGTSFSKAVTVGIDIRPVTTFSRLDTLECEHRQRYDSTRDNLDERIGECSKWVDNKFREDEQMPGKYSIDIEEANDNNLHIIQTDGKRLDLDQINMEVRRLISNYQINEAIAFFQDRQRIHSSERQEEQLNSKKGDLDRGCYLYEDTVRYMIKWFVRNQENLTSEGILFALCQEEVPQDHHTAQILRIYTRNKKGLIELLPKALQDLFNTQKTKRSWKKEVPKDDLGQKIGEDVRQRLLIPIAIALVQERSLRLAKWLLQRCEEIGVKRMPVGTGNVFAEAAVQHANSTTGYGGMNAVGQITSAIRYLNECQDVRDDVLIRSNGIVLRRLSVIMGQSFSLLQPGEWRGMLRKLSLICLRNGPLMMRSLQSKKDGIPMLISLHIKAEDYTYAKRLFELYQDYYGRYTNESPFSPNEFAWMFETSLKDEDSIDFIVKLFSHWLISDLSSSNRMPHFLPSQLRRYSSRLMETKRGGEVLPLLPLFGLDRETETVAGQQRVIKRIEKRAQARRTIGVFANTSPKFFLDLIPFLQELLAFLRDRSEGFFDEHLIELHLYVVDKSRSAEKYATSLELMRTQMLSIVESMRQHAVKVAKGTSQFQSTITSETSISLQLLYKRILRYIGGSLAADKTIYRLQDEDRDTFLADTLDSMLMEMQSLWSINLEELDRKSADLAITVCKLQVMMARRDWQGAIALYTKTMNENAERWERFTDFTETSESIEYPPPPLHLNVATRLALALGQGGQFDKARQILSTYTRCTKQFKSTFFNDKEETEEDFAADEVSEESKQNTRKIKDHNRLLIECTGIALLCLQNRKEEALARIYSLERLGVFGAYPQPHTPLMFFSEQRQSQKAGFNFNSNVRPTLFPAAAPSIGPTNKDLTFIYIEALASIPMKARSADWQGLLANSQKQLSDYTGAKDVSSTYRI